MKTDHVIMIHEEGERSIWECSCGHGGSAPSWKADVAAEKHVEPGESVAYRTPRKKEGR
jgi:hypothetical protein